MFSKTGRGNVREQNPKAGAEVKEGRRIQLVINAKTVQKVAVPNLIGYSARQAVAELNSRGLTLGQFIYVSDMATNNVLKQKYKGRDIASGTMVEAEAPIDPATHKPKIYTRFDCFVRAAIFRSLSK